MIDISAHRSSIRTSPVPPRAASRQDDNPSVPSDILLTAPSPERTKSQLREFGEAGLGLFGGLSRGIGSLVSGSLVGAYFGGKRSLVEDYDVKPESVAKGLVLTNGIQQLARGSVLGFAVAGSAGAAIKATQEIVTTGLNLCLFVEGGSAKEMGAKVAGAIETAVDSDDCLAGGVVKGAYAAAASAATSGYSTGKSEGRGAFDGLIEGFQELSAELGQLKRPQGNLLNQAWKMGIAYVCSLAVVPAGLGMGFMKRNDIHKSIPVLQQKLLAAGGGALMLGWAGSHAGLPGMVIGAAVGALAGLHGAASKPDFYPKAAKQLEKAQQNDFDLGDDIANKRRDVVQNILVSTGSAVAQTWESITGPTSSK
jgi:gas vesicle protein